MVLPAFLGQNYSNIQEIQKQYKAEHLDSTFMIYDWFTNVFSTSTLATAFLVVSQGKLGPIPGGTGHGCTGCLCRGCQPVTGHTPTNTISYSERAMNLTPCLWPARRNRHNMGRTSKVHTHSNDWIQHLAMLGMRQ